MARQERPFGGINILGLRTQERPRGVGAPTLPPPTREAPPPPIRRQNGLAQTLEEAVVQDSRRTAEKPKNPNKIRVLMSRGILAGLALAGGTWGIKHYAFGDNPSSANSQTRSIDSFGPTSFNNKEGPILVETKKVNPEEVFDSAATKDILKAGVNATVATQEELAILFKKAIVPGEDGKPPKIRIPIPAKLKEGQSIEYSHHILTNEGAYYLDEPNRKPPPTTTFFGMDFITKEENTEIPLLAERAEVFQFPPVEDKGKLYFSTLVLKITLSNGNPIFATIVSPDNIRNLVPEDIVKNAPIVTLFPEDATPDMPYIAEAKNGIPLAVEDGKVPSILRTTRPNTHIRISFRDLTPNTYSTGNLPFEIRSGNLPFNFMELENNNEAKAIIVP